MAEFKPGRIKERPFQWVLRDYVPHWLRINYLDDIASNFIGQTLLNHDIKNSQIFYFWYLKHSKSSNFAITCFSDKLAKNKVENFSQMFV